MSTIRVDRIENRLGEFGFDVEQVLNHRLPFNKQMEYPVGSLGAAVKEGNGDSELRQDLTDPTKGSSLISFKERDVFSKLQDIVDVKDYGAKGDGVTDDTASILAARTYCIENKARLWFSSGKYLVKQTFELYDYADIYFQGESWLIAGVENLTFFKSSVHAYFSNVWSPRFDGNGFAGCVGFDVTNMRLDSGIHNSYFTDIEYGIIARSGCFGLSINNPTAYHGVPNPITFTENCATAVVRNPNLDNVTGNQAQTGYGIKIWKSGIPNEGVIIDGGYVQGFVRGIWDEGRGTRVSGTYFEQCSEADVYSGGSIQSSYDDCQHFAEIGNAAYVFRETDGCSVLRPNMASGGRTVLYDVDSSNNNFVEFRPGSTTFDNVPTGSLDNVKSLVTERVVSFQSSISGTVSAGSATYQNNFGELILRGKSKIIKVDCQWSGHTGTGNIKITGIPAGVLTSKSYQDTAIPVVSGISITGIPYIFNSSGGLELVLATVSSGSESLVPISASGRIRFTITL